MGTQRTQSALLCSNLLDSHCQTDGIATDKSCKYTPFFSNTKKKFYLQTKSALLFMPQKYNTPYAKN